MAKINLVAAIVACFIEHQNENTIYSTGDGNCFLEGGKRHAEHHAKVNNLTCREVKREDYTKEIEAAQAAANDATTSGKGKAKASKPADESAEAGTSGAAATTDAPESEGRVKGKGKGAKADEEK